MNRRDWLLVLLGQPMTAPLDPVRLQKCLFLLSQEADLPLDERYAFEPYDYGPFSPQIYADLDGLLQQGLVEQLDTPGYTWKRYQASSQGLARVAELQQQANEGDRRGLARLQELKRQVLGLSFNQLLRYVYGRYPDYARNSVFR
jgi:uncharacterized protein